MSHAELRLKRFRQAQAALDESLRLENRNDLDVTHQKHRMKSTLEQHRAAKRWFIEYLQVQTPELDPQRYFNPEHPPPDRVLLKKYAIFMAQSRVGNIADTISVRTLINYTRLLFTVFGIDRGRRLDKALTDDVQAYVYNDMVKEYQLSRAQWKKPVAHSEDLTYLISVLYTPQFIGTLSNMRQLMNLTLFLNIMVDTGSRGGDIAWDRKTEPGTCLLWEDIKLYAFWNESIDAVDIRANLTFRYLKGMKLEPGQYKTVPLSLFPISMVKEDTLRLILIMALMDGVFESDLRTWSDLMAVPNSVNGRIIPIKESFQKLSLLRKVDGHKFSLTEGPEQLRDLQALTKRLGRAAGLEDRLTVYCLRRGVAFTLALKTSADDRRFLMGHKTASKIYSEYASKVATVDLAALYRDHDPRSVKQMSSMLLNSSTEAPQSISNEGRAMAKLDPKYLSLQSIADELREAIVLRHGSLAAAARSTDRELARYKASFSKASHAFEAACARIYRQEYAQFFEASERPGSAASSRTSRESTASIMSMSTNTTLSDADDLNALPLDPEAFLPPTGPDEDPIYEIDEDFSTNIDPVLLRMDGEDLLALDLQDLSVESALGDDEDPPLEPETTTLAWIERLDPAAHLRYGVDPAEQPVDGVNPTEQSVDSVNSAAQSTRLHGISRNDQACIDAYLAGQQGSSLHRQRRDNSGIDRTYVDPTLCNHMLTVFESDGNEAEMASVLGAFFKIVHPIDRFFPGQEPVPGSYRCMFCDEDLAGVIHSSLHVYKCALTEATDRSYRIADELFPFDRPCAYTNLKKVNGVWDLVQCGKTFSDRKAFGVHVGSHHFGKTQMIPDEHNNLVLSCFYTPCAELPSGLRGPRPSRTGIVFQSREERQSHMMTHHQLISTWNPKPTFCEFCYEFVLPHELDAHFELHIDAADSLVKANGYTGLMGVGRTLQPRLCIFCFHDRSINVSQRLDTQCSQGIDRYHRHINMHLKAIEYAIPCPAFPDLCTMSEPLDSMQMKHHLAAVHGIIVKDYSKRKKSDKDDEGDEDGIEVHDDE